jgi:hypothetical protein
VEELVSDAKRKGIAAAFAAAGLLPLVAAGAAWLLRGHAANELADLQRVTGELAQRVERERERIALAAAAPAGETAGSPWRLHDTPDVAGTMQWLQTSADRAGITIEQMKAVPTAVAGKQSFAVAGHGAPQQVCAWLAALERHERVLVVESGRVGASGTDRIAIELGIAAWHAGAER